MKITLHGTTIHRDGHPVGILTPDRTFQPTIRLQTRTIQKITAILSTLQATPESNKETTDPGAESEPNKETPDPGDERADPAPPVPGEAASQQDAQERSTLDPEPEMLSEAGDKTPAYIEWYRRNHSAEAFRAKYAHRKIL